MSTITNTVHRSKWGYHPVSRETCAKLKKAHKLLLRAYRDIRKLDRWNIKLNKIGQQPNAPEFLIKNGCHYRKSIIRYGYHMMTVDNNLSLYHNILKCYRIARKPVESPILVQNIHILCDLDEIIAKLEEFYTLV